MLKAIDTVYDGHRFRSRLEARWGVFFRTLKINYWYEKEGFELNNGKRTLYYLPDFFIPHLNCWIEIKPAPPTEEENLKAQLLCSASNQDVLIFYGDIPNPSGFYDGADKFFAGDYLGWDNNYMWCECPDCGFLGIEFEGRSDRMKCKKCFICQTLEKDKNSFGWVLNQYSTWSDSDKELLLKGICPRHADKPSEGCQRTGGNLDRGHTADSPRLLNAYEIARQYRFEHGENNGVANRLPDNQIVF